MHTIKYYSAINTNKQLIQETTWRNFKSILLSERNNSKDSILHDFVWMKFQKVEDREEISCSGPSVEGR